MKYMPSTGGPERLFPTMGFIHSHFRNRLGVPKVEKLTFVMRYLNDIE